MKNNQSEKINQLSQLKAKLKEEFIGLDVTIDRVVDSLTTWFIYRDHFTLPYPICIWGPTGTGKTKMAKRIVEILGLNLSYVDVRDIQNEQFLNLNRYFDVVILDEFQNSGSKNENQSYDRKTKNRNKIIWSFLSEGDATLDSSEIYKDVCYSLNSSLLRVMENLSDDSQKLDIESIKKQIINYAEIMRGQFIASHGKLFDFAPNSVFLSKVKTLEGVAELSRACSYFSIDQYSPESSLDAEELMEKSSETQIPEIKNRRLGLGGLRFRSRAGDEILKLKKVEKCNPLVFVLGNLDSIYSEFLNDINLTDSVKDKIMKMSNNDLIKELSHLFFPEEISRLGKNQVLFPVLSKDEYQKILDRRMSETINKLESDGISLSFSPEVKNLIYLELIDPRFGVRAIDSSFRSIFESSIISASLNLKIKENVDKITIILSIKSKRTIIAKSNNFSEEIEIPKFNYQDELYPVEVQKRIAIHEAGHALSGYLLTKKAPEYIRTRLTSSEVGGFVNFADNSSEEMETKKTLLNSIQIVLAGLVSESIFYGNDDISAGAYSDLKKATGIASSMIYKLGMGKHLIHSNVNNGSAKLRSLEKELDSEVLAIINESQIKILKLLNENKKTLEKLAQKLSEVTYLSGTEFLEIVKGD